VGRKTLMLASGATLCAFCLLACTPLPPAPHPPSEPSCGQVCAHWRQLGCEEARNTAGGATCEDVCHMVTRSRVVRWDLACMATVDSCDAIDGCNE